MEKNMTAGNPAKLIINFTLPVFAGCLFQQIYSMVDTIIVGKFVSTEALAAVGSTNTINFCILGMLMGLMSGITVMTSQRFGASDLKGMKKSVGCAAWIAVIASLIMTLISMLGMRRLLVFMHTPENIMDDAYRYFMIICAGIIAQVLYNLFACILRALGNSKTPLYFLILSASLNIILDLVLIVVFHMGVAGAAIATIFSQGVSAFLCLIYMIKKVDILDMSKEDFIPDGTMIRKQLSVGLPMAFQYSITAIGSMMVQSSLNMLGSMHVAAFTAANRAEQLVGQMYVALGSAMAVYCAQNVGAGDYDRVRQGFKVATIFGFIFSVVMGLILFFFGYHVTGLFVSEGVQELEGLVDIFMKCTGSFLIPLTIVNVFRNGIQGMGYGLMPMMAGVAELAGRGSAAIIAAHYKSYVGVCMASPAAWVLASGLLIFMYFHVMKTKK